MAGAPTTGAAVPQQLGAAQLSQQVVSQQQSFFLRENRPRRFGFSQQTGSQQLDWQQLLWQQEVVPQQAGAAGAQHDGAQLLWQAGAQHGWAQGAGQQLTVSQQQSLLLRERHFLVFWQQQSLTQQSLTAPHDPPHEEATGAGWTAAAGAGAGYCPALTVVSSTIKTFTGVILRKVRGSAAAGLAWIGPSLPGEKADGAFLSCQPGSRSLPRSLLTRSLPSWIDHPACRLDGSP